LQNDVADVLMVDMAGELLKLVELVQREVGSHVALQVVCQRRKIEQQVSGVELLVELL